MLGRMLPDKAIGRTGVVAGGARPMWPIGMPPGMINWCSGILSKVVQTSVQGL